MMIASGGRSSDRPHFFVSQTRSDLELAAELLQVIGDQLKLAFRYGLQTKLGGSLAGNDSSEASSTMSQRGGGKRIVSGPAGRGLPPRTSASDSSEARSRLAGLRRGAMEISVKA
jgi:hypothetical protein